MHSRSTPRMSTRPRARRALALVAGASAAALVLTACSGGSDGEGGGGGADDPIVVGISLPLTGDFSEPGKGVQRGYEAWAQFVNEDGGLLGREVRLKILDDQSNADRVVQDYEALIAQDEVDLVFGPFSTRLVVPSARVAEEYGMLFVEPAGAANEVFEQGFENLFYAAPAVADDHYNYLADHILDMPEAERPQTVAVAAMDDPFAQGTAYGLRDKLADAGLDVVVDEVYPPNTTDFSSIAAKINDSGADMVIGGTQYQDAVNLIVALQQLDYQPMLAASRPRRRTPSSPPRSARRPRASSRPRATRRPRAGRRTSTSSSGTRSCTATRPARTRPTRTRPARSSPPPSRPSGAPSRASASRSSSRGCGTTRSRPSSGR